MGKKKGTLKKAIQGAKKVVQVAQKVAKNPIVRGVAKVVHQNLPKKQKNWVDSGLNAASKINRVAGTVQRSLPAIAGAITAVRNDQTTTERFEWDLVSGISGAVPSNGLMEINVPLVPYDAYGLSNSGGGTPQVEWDKTLQAFFPRFTHFRVKSFSITYTGTAATTATGTAYMASAEDPTTDIPNFTEFTMMERNIKGPVFEPGFSLACSHDLDWHPIDPSKTFSSIAPNSTDRKVHWAGIAFIALTELNIATVRFRIAATFEFKGRNPAFASVISQALFAGTQTGGAVTNEWQNNLSIGQGGVNPRWNNINSATEANYTLDAGWHLISAQETTFVAGQAAASGTVVLIDIFNNNASVKDATRVALDWNTGTIIQTATKAPQANVNGTLTNIFAAETLAMTQAWCLVKSKPGDQLVIRDGLGNSDQVNGTTIIMHDARLTTIQATAVWNKYETGALPL